MHPSSGREHGQGTGSSRAPSCPDSAAHYSDSLLCPMVCGCWPVRAIECCQLCQEVDPWIWPKLSSPSNIMADGPILAARRPRRLSGSWAGVYILNDHRARVRGRWCPRHVAPVHCSVCQPCPAFRSSGTVYTRDRSMWNLSIACRCGALLPPHCGANRTGTACRRIAAGTAAGTSTLLVWVTVVIRCR